jgi:predicted AlkP superfamily phosphohydrolase/phosphomutase
VSLDLDPLLLHLGLITKTGTTVDFSKSKLYNYETAGFQMEKMVRFALAGREPGGAVTADQEAAIRADFTQKLAGVTYDDGSPVFVVRDAKPYEQKKGADFMVDVQTKNPSSTLHYQGQAFGDVVKAIVEHSGGHGWCPPGVFMASGPDIDPKAALDGIRIHDITPTILYGMGLPVAQDFAGKPWTTLYSAAYQKAHPVQTIPSYGTLTNTHATTNSQTDTEMLEQLRALGYIQ